MAYTLWYTMADSTWAGFISFFNDTLALLDNTVNAMMGFPPLGIGLAAGIMAVAFGLAYQVTHASKR